MPENETTVVSSDVEGAKPDDLGEAGLKALKTERESRKAAERERDEFAAKVKEFEDQKKSDSEKLQEQLAALTERATKAERERSRALVIATHQIPADYQDLVQGDDEDALAASAAKVRTLIDSKPSADRATLVIPDEGGSPALALNGDGLEAALKKALGIS